MRRPTIRSRGRPPTSGRARGKAASRRVLSRSPTSRARTPISGVPTSRARARRTRNMRADAAINQANLKQAQQTAARAANSNKTGSTSQQRVKAPSQASQMQRQFARSNRNLIRNATRRAGR